MQGEWGLLAQSKAFLAASLKVGGGRTRLSLLPHSQAGKDSSAYFLSHSPQRLEIKTLNFTLLFSSGSGVIVIPGRKPGGPSLLADSFSVNYYNREKMNEPLWLF